MNDNAMKHKAHEVGNTDKPIWEKKCLSIEEAAAYSGIGIIKLRQLSQQKKCPFVKPIGNQIFIVRENWTFILKTKSVFRRYGYTKSRKCKVNVM